MESVSGEKICGKMISVIGMGRSGMAVASLLNRRGAKVFISDSGEEKNLRSQTASLVSAGIEFETGSHTDRLLDAEILVISPGIASDAGIVKKAADKGIKIVSELEIASWFFHAPIIAVTGTNGKTTTTALLGRMMNDADIRSFTGGNIGTAFSSFIDGSDSRSVAVLEVSSFQLDHIEKFHPKVAVILNLTPDHLDRYENSFERYIVSKCRIFENQTKEDFLIYNCDDPETREQVRRLASLHVRLLPFGMNRTSGEGAFIEDGKVVTVVEGKRAEIVSASEIGIRGVHNLYNSMAAALAARIMGAGPDSLGYTLRTFRGVEHRLEFVRELDGVKYVNDSKATNVDSVWYALQAFGEQLVVLIGGRDKGNDYRKLEALVKNHVKAVVAIGESAEKVYTAFNNIKNVVKAASMDEAVRKARDLASSGDIVLLSPACASFDWFRNYEHRGEVFKQIVNGL